jgi:thioesterase domain-containing protein
LDGNGALQSDIKKMAESYIKEMKSVQPEGPYCLGGYCLGGTIAFEIAQQLKQRGDEVSLIAMFESYNIKEKPGTIPSFLKLLHKFQNAYFQIRNLILSKSGGNYKYFKEKASVELSRYKVKINILYSRIASKLNVNYGVKYQHLLIDKVNDQAQADYMPSNYRGKITLFRPKTNYAGFNDPYFGWSKLAEKGVEIINMPVYPRGTLNEPFVQLLADRLRKQIDEANNYSDRV